MRKLITPAAAAAALSVCAGCFTTVGSDWQRKTDGTLHGKVRVISTGIQSEAVAKGIDVGPEGALLEDASGKQDSTAAIVAMSEAIAVIAPLARERMAQLAAAQAAKAAAQAAAPAGGDCPACPACPSGTPEAPAAPTADAK